MIRHFTVYHQNETTVSILSEQRLQYVCVNAKERKTFGRLRPHHHKFRQTSEMVLAMCVVVWFWSLYVVRSGQMCLTVECWSFSCPKTCSTCVESMKNVSAKSRPQGCIDAPYERFAREPGRLSRGRRRCRRDGFKNTTFEKDRWHTLPRIHIYSRRPKAT